MYCELIISERKKPILIEEKWFSLNFGLYLPEMNLAFFVITVFKSTPIPVISGAIIQVDYGLLDTDKILI